MVTLGMFVKGNQLFCGLFKQGLDVIQLPENKVYHYTPEELNIGEGSVYTFFIDEAGYKWIGTGWGLYKAAPASFHFEKVEEVGFDWIFDAFQDKDGMIWFASMGSGLWKHDPGKNSFKKYTYGFGFPLIVVEFVVTILKRMILPLFPLKTVCRMMWLIRYWKMSNQIYGSGQIGG